MRNTTVCYGIDNTPSARGKKLNSGRICSRPHTPPSPMWIPDGDRDVVVSILGNIYPDDRVIGKVVLLENVGNSGGTGPFKQHVIFDDVRRVADVQVGDLDGDKDMDMVVAVFGYRRGNIYWLENHGDHKFEEHELLYAAGTIHVPLADYDSRRRSGYRRRCVARPRRSDRFRKRRQRTI